MTKQRNNRESNMIKQYSLLFRQFCTWHIAMEGGDRDHGNTDTFLRDAREDSAANT
jgi:hypothetical protein